MAHSQDCTMKGIIIHVGILCGWTVTHPFNLFVGVGVGVGGRVALSDSLCTHTLCLDICAYCSHKLCRFSSYMYTRMYRHKNYAAAEG